MQLLSLNIEGDRHLARVNALIDRVSPDCICLQEAPAFFVDDLKKVGYHTTFAPLTIRVRDNAQFVEGVAIATKRTPSNSQVHYYHKPHASPVPFVKDSYRQTMAKAIVTVSVEGLQLATTHFTWTERGEIPNAYQLEDIEAILNYLKALPPHVLVGDLNIPRFHNPLYERLVEHYTDHIPLTYQSSLDATLHRAGNDPERAHLFTSFMVDHLLVQPPITTANVELIFGVSDHAVIRAELFTHNS